MFNRYIVGFNKDIEIEYTDIVVVGAGLAGLFTALQIDIKHKVVIITKGSIEDSNTQEAQGGIAAAICKHDSTNLHKLDTLNAGHGLCNSKIVEEVVKNGPKAIETLLGYGVPFDTKEGNISLTREGAHSRKRVLHANGDGTGRVMRETLTNQVFARNNIKLLENTFVIDIYTDVQGVRGVFIKKGNKIRLIAAKYVVIASGGAGQLYKYTTNPKVATGDGIAMAYRANADLRDLEFVQFHPTALTTNNAPNFLISEAVRGEGGILKNHKNQAFMENYHPLRELAPRDVVSRAMLEQMENSQKDHLYLDVSHMDEGQMQIRFPNIFKNCRKYGIEVPIEPIPVAPAAHYIMGGITIDWWGRTNICGLLACGEATSSGLHGANRLASNSLLEALVFSQNIASYINNNIIPEEKIVIKLPERFSSIYKGTIRGRELKDELQSIMWKYAGLKRNDQGLEKLVKRLNEMLSSLREPEEILDFEVINMLQLSLKLAKGAKERKESRGGHYREDYPVANSNWKKHINFNKNKDMWFSEIH